MPSSAVALYDAVVSVSGEGLFLGSRGCIDKAQGSTKSTHGAMSLAELAGGPDGSGPANIDGRAGEGSLETDGSGRPPPHPLHASPQPVLPAPPLPPLSATQLQHIKVLKCAQAVLDQCKILGGNAPGDTSDQPLAVFLSTDVHKNRALTVRRPTPNA